MEGGSYGDMTGLIGNRMQENGNEVAGHEKMLLLLTRKYSERGHPRHGHEAQN